MRANHPDSGTGRVGRSRPPTPGVDVRNGSCSAFGRTWRPDGCCNPLHLFGHRSINTSGTMNPRGRRGPRCRIVFCLVRFQSEGPWKVLDAEPLHALPESEWDQRHFLPCVAGAAAAIAEAQGKNLKKGHPHHSAEDGVPGQFIRSCRDRGARQLEHPGPMCSSAPWSQRLLRTASMRVGSPVRDGQQPSSWLRSCCLSI